MPSDQSAATTVYRPTRVSPNSKCPKSKRGKDVGALLFMSILLNIIFFPVVWGNETLLFGAHSVPSVMPYGAYVNGQLANKPLSPYIRTYDAGAPAWFAEPSYQAVHLAYFRDKSLPLWNPYVGYGMPLLANMQSQPFFPLTFIAFICATAKAIDLFLISRLFFSGLFMFMFLRMFTATVPSLFGAVSYMLTGYLIIYMNMPEISVAMMLPALFAAFELLVRKPSIATTTLGAFVVALTLLGGMPELSFLVLLYAGFYYCFRLIMTKRSFDRAMCSILAFAAANLAGLCLASPQIALFVEYIGQSSNTHINSSAGVIGLLAEPEYWKQAFKYFLPLDYGLLLRLKKEIMPAGVTTHGYWGIIVTFSALMAIMGSVLCAKKPRSRNAMLAQMVVFFSLSSLFFILKKFGSPLVNWVGYLPVFKLVIFPKYDEPLLAFSVSTLAAIGLFWFARGCITRRTVKITMLLMLSTFAFLASSDLLFSRFHVNKALLFSWMIFVLVSIVLFIVALYGTSTNRLKSNAVRTFVALAAIELCVNFIFPYFYLFSHLPLRAYDPYKGAPFVSFLSQHTRKYERMFAQDGILYPNWAAAFELMDIRALDAMYPGRYLPFVRNLVTGMPGRAATRGGDDLNLANRFVGQEYDIPSAAVLSKKSNVYRLFELSSVKYLVSSKIERRPAKEMLEIVDQNKGRINDSFTWRVFTMPDGMSFPVIFQHPNAGSAPTNQVRYRTFVLPDKPILSVSYGISPQFWNDGCGDGATFYLQVEDRKGVHAMLSRYVNPSGNTADRRWFHDEIDMRRFAGQPIVLILSTDAGPRGDSEFDWAGWSHINWTPTHGLCSHSGIAPDILRRVYNNEVDIYETARALPRLSYYNHVRLLSNDNDELALLRDPSFNIWKEATVNSHELTQPELNVLKDVNVQTPHEAIEQRIVGYAGQSIEAEVRSPNVGLLMLNDTFFPGWHAYVD
jgi:hypothetical protein